MRENPRDNPLISVIIPVYNTEKYLAESIESVFSQTYRPVELIVVDDGSTDGSAAVARRYLPRLTCLRQANAGSSAARNAGLLAAQGDFYAFLDADDIWTEDKLALQFAAFRSDPRLDVIFGHIEQFYSPELDAEYRKRISCPGGLIPGYCSSTMLVKRQAFLRAGMFNPEVFIGEDMEWYFRAQEADLQIGMLPDLVYRRRLHETNKGLVRKQQQIQRVRIIKAALDRRRSKNAGGKEDKTLQDNPAAESPPDSPP